MRQPNNFQWRLLVIVFLLVVFVWPPRGDRSLALKFVNWVVDPANKLPVLPDPLPLTLGDDPDAVLKHDLQALRYDDLYLKGGWTRRRLELKVAGDPFNPGTERQVLVGIAGLAAFLAWRSGGQRSEKAPD